MGKQAHQSIIELNGQRYNAQTGKLIEGVSLPISTPDNVRGLSIDGVARKPLAPRGKTASNEIHKTTQPGKTLMRRAVKKPSTITNRKTVAMDVMPQAHSQASVTVFHSVNPSREHRAEAIRQNSLVSRFGGELREAATNTKPLGAKSPVTSIQPPTIEPTIKPNTATLNQTLASKMLAKGLRNANSHEETTLKKAKLHHRVGRKLGLDAKAASIATGSLAVLIIGGFFLYQNIPNISVRLASLKAGVHASLPSYQPGGFTVNSHVQYSPGAIAVSYKANADNRAYTVTQKATNWNSTALKEHLSSASNNMPQNYSDGGRTIYLHDESQADWVNNGVWYSISGDSKLTRDQIIKIATSL